MARDIPDLSSASDFENQFPSRRALPYRQKGPASLKQLFRAVTTCAVTPLAGSDLVECFLVIGGGRWTVETPRLTASDAPIYVRKASEQAAVEAYTQNVRQDAYDASRHMPSR